MAKQRFFRGGYGRFFVLAVTFLLLSNYPFAAAQSTSEPPPKADTNKAGAASRYRIFPLKHISIEQGKKYLADAQLGTVTHLPGTAALLVTAQPDELIKAKTILDLVDSQEPFVIEAILPASMAKNIPSNEQIAAQLGNMSIGSFSNPPDNNAAAKAIIDINNDSVVIIAPAGRFGEIAFAIEQLKKEQEQAKEVKKQPADKYFMKKAQQPAVPNEPKAVGTVLEQKPPGQKAPEPPASSYRKTGAGAPTDAFSFLDAPCPILGENRCAILLSATVVPATTAKYCQPKIGKDNVQSYRNQTRYSKLDTRYSIANRLFTSVL